MPIVGVIPEAVEFDALACLEARTAALSTFRDLGSFDLVQLTKLRQGTETSTYHHVTGVNISSSAAAAAHLNTLTFSLGDNQLWFGSHRHWKIINGTYCAWNAFSRVDVRVKAAIPGGVENYTVSPTGAIENSVSDQCWLETYMSAMIRALLYTDDDAYFLECTRREDPFATKADAHQFFYAFEVLFGIGPRIGSSPKHQLATLTSNHMVEAFFTTAQVTGLWDDARACIERISEKVPEARDLLVRIDILSNNEIDAVKLLVDIVRKNPQNAEMLVQEAEFCLAKGKPELAFDCAQRATTASPGQFFTWETLAKVYVELGKYPDALLAINSRPMISRPPMDTVKMPAPRKVHSPLPSDGSIEEIWNLNTSEIDPVDPSLLKLSGGSLRGGQRWAYDILAKVFSKVGWAELMRIRGDIFLMEQESSTESKPKAEEGKTDGIKAEDSAETGDVAAASDADPSAEATEEAAEKITTDSEAESEPQPAQESATLDANGLQPSVASQEEPSSRKSIKSKRLCERRLDMLFMTLWEDARAHSHWQREAVHFESAQTSYNRTATEWEILGCISQRLHYDEQAMDAFNKSLAQRFCHRVAWHMLDYYAPSDDKIKNISLALQLVVKLYAWNHRWHVEFSPRLRTTLNKIVQSEGLLKVRTEVQASFSGTKVIRLIELELEKIKLLSE